MKPYLLILVAAFCAAVIPFKSFAAEPENGHVLTSLWSEYDKCVSDDLPKKTLSVIERIKKEALSRKLPYDYYDAAVAYVDVATGRNWKLRDSLACVLNDEILRFGSPALIFHHMSSYKGSSASEMWDFIKANKSAMESSHLKVFYSNAPYFFKYDPCDKVLARRISNDYEFALWVVYARESYYWGEEDEKISEALTDYVGTKYPFEAILEYSRLEKIGTDSDRKAALENLIKKYKGKAAGLLFEERILSGRFSDLSNGNASSREFKDFHSECLEFEKRRAAFKGEEKEIASACVKVEDIIRTMESESINLSVHNDKVTVSLRNLGGAKLALLDKNGKELKTYSVTNKAGSFYAPDTVKLDIGPLDDGDYSLKASKGDVEDETIYEKKTLSVVSRQGPKAMQIYVADYMTGKPLKAVRLDLYKGDKLVMSENSHALNGFTYLPESFERYISSKNNSFVLVCFDVDSGRLRMSRNTSLNKHFFDDQPTPKLQSEGTYASLLLDCAAFHPGDEVRFKAVLYSGNLTKALKVFPKGKSVEARLIDPSGDVVASKTLKTNELGSVASSFKLEKLSHNGYCSIEIYSGSKMLTSKRFDVDDFALPTFEIKFTPSEKPRFAGDMNLVKGSIKAYSGHNLSSASVSYVIKRWNEAVAEGPLAPAKDGSFEVQLDPKLETGYYNVTIKVVDSTGETLENTCSFNLSESFGLSLSVPGKVDGDFQRTVSDKCYYDYAVLASVESGIVFDASLGGLTVPVKIFYKILKGDKTILSGEADPREEIQLSLPEEGEYLVKFNASYKARSGRETKVDETFRLLRINPDSSSLSFECENFFMMKDEGTKDEISFLMGSPTETWAIAELYDVDSRFVASKKIHIPSGDDNIQTISFPFSKEYSDAIAVKVFYFKNGREYGWTREFHRPLTSINLPLTFSRFEDKTLPGVEYSIALQAWKGAEAALAVFDKATEAVSPNVWSKAALRARTASAPYFHASCGKAESRPNNPVYVAYGARTMTKSSLMNFSESAVAEEELMSDSQENASVMADSLTDDDIEAAAGVEVREDFADVLAFEPFVNTGTDGAAEVKFRTSDKLSTYIVSLFAHDADMNNNVVRSELTVTMPVKVSIVQPKVLYRGDKYVALATVASTSEEKISGKLMFFAYDKGSYDGEAFVALKKEVVIEAGGSVSAEFPVDIPEGAIETLGLKLVFVGEGFSDASFVTVPVKPRSQILTEAHSAVLLDGMSEDDLLSRLRGEFTGTSSCGAEYFERNVFDMVLDAIPSRIDPSSANVLALSEALYVRNFASMMNAAAASESGLSDEALISKILLCRNSDGGFAWFEGMPSSPIITAVLLDRFHRMDSHGLLPEAIASITGDAVKYLDSSYFNMKKLPWWCGWLRLEQYLYIRSEFASVPFTAKVSKDFRKEARAFLFPKNNRAIAGGSVYSKVRRASSLARLQSEDGKALARAWGLGSFLDKKLAQSLKADMLSLSEYAVPHKDGGLYYPNMVSPYGGLLESQLHTHVALLDLLDLTGELPEVADGVRLWMLLQKETQQWDPEVCYIDAISSILDGSESLKATKVIVLRKTYEKPFEEIVPAGNAMTIERVFQKVSPDGKKTELKEGDRLSVGDRVVAEYKVYSEDYRSFVKITAPRPGCLTPVEQTSGRYGWRFSPVRAFAGGMAIEVSPSGYRDSRTDCSEYWFDCFPEEKTTISEEFYVTQKGSFALPALEVESLYAPHYRANSSFTLLNF